MISSSCCPAVIVVSDADSASATIASLTVLDRLVISLSRAGVERILVVDKTQPVLARSAALGIRWEYSDRLPQSSGAVLVGLGNVLVTSADIRRILEVQGRLTTSDSQSLPIGVVEGINDWQARLAEAPPVRARDLTALVTSATVRQVEQAYWASLTSSSDGWVDRHFNRPLGRVLSKGLVRTAVSPNQVSLFATLVGLGSGWLFAVGTAQAALVGAIVLQLSAVLDCIDGDLARALYKQSALGKWLDIVGDQVVHIGVFLGIAVGLWRSGSTAPVLLLGAVAAAGVVLSFIVVLRTLRKPERRGHSRLQKMIDATTNRDFSVLLILFALFEVLDWFLWMAAVGSHAFWLAALTLQWQGTRTNQVHAEGV
ncbi:MAG: CDP-alcohol phosphatidyltransferase family protein [Verrucomicrobiia bacterium]